MYKLLLALPIYISAQTTDSVYTYLQQIGVKHADIVTKQAILETGHFKSTICIENNNLFGMKLPKKRETLAIGENKGHAKYKNWKESIKDYKIWQDKKYKGGDYYDFLYELGYATDPKYIQKLNKININK